MCPTLLNNMVIMMMMVMMMMLLMIIIIMMITRFKNGTLVKNSSEYLIKQTANLPDYTTNTLSYVQVGCTCVPMCKNHLLCSTYAHVNVNLYFYAVFPSPQHLCLEKRLGQFLILYIPLHHEHH